MGGIIYRIVDTWRRTAVSVRAATVLAVVAGAATLPMLRRWLQDESAPAGPEPAEAKPPLSPTENGSHSGDRPEPSWIWLVGAFARRGLTPTVAVLAILGAIPLTYALWILPATDVPQPRPSSIEIDFSPGHPASSPLTVGMWLQREQPADGTGNSNQVVLAIDITGADLARSGWSITGIMPVGVHINGALGNDPRTGRVTRYPGSDKTAFVSVAPGPVAGGRYSVILFWNNLHSGPMQVEGANLAATFPDVTVDNQATAGSDNAPSPPEPQVTVTRELVPFGDFAYLGGLPPDRLNGSGWSWEGTTFPANGGAGAFSYGLDVEARSPTQDAQASDAGFRSGIALGIAAAAFIAAIQEFVKTASRKQDTNTGHQDTNSLNASTLGPTV